MCAALSPVFFDIKQYIINVLNRAAYDIKNHFCSDNDAIYIVKLHILTLFFKEYIKNKRNIICNVNSILPKSILCILNEYILPKNIHNYNIDSIFDYNNDTQILFTLDTLVLIQIHTDEFCKLWGEWYESYTINNFDNKRREKAKRQCKEFMSW